MAKQPAASTFGKDEFVCQTVTNLGGDVRTKICSMDKDTSYNKYSFVVGRGE